MRVALFGASGRVGRRLLAQGTARGWAFRVLARDPARVAAPDGASVEVVTGDVHTPDAVARTVAGCDAVLSALGGDGLDTPGTARSVGMRHIVAAMQAHGVARVAAVAGGGILDAPGGGLRNQQPGFPAVFREVTREHQGTWDAVRESGLSWTLFCPPDIPDGPPTGQYRMREDLMPDGPGRTLWTGDLAEAMLDALAAGTFPCRRVGIKQ